MIDNSMRSNLNFATKEICLDRLVAAGLRLTRPRQAIARILFANSYNHFTADDVLAAAKCAGERLSLATVYNTLNDFAAHGFIRRLATPGGPAQFDTRPGDHHHFYIEADNQVIDVAHDEVTFSRLPAPPPGYRIANIDVVIHLQRLETIAAFPLSMRQSPESDHLKTNDRDACHAHAKDMSYPQSEK